MNMLERIKKYFQGPLFELEPFGFNQDISFRKDGLYAIEIINDEKTTMIFVVRLLERYFECSKRLATEVMLKIHTEGSAKVGEFDEEVAERLASHLEKQAEKHGFPLRCRKAKVL